MTTIKEIDLNEISELETQIQEIDLLVAVARNLIRTNPVALEKILQVARKQIWNLQEKIDHKISNTAESIIGIKEEIRNE